MDMAVTTILRQHLIDPEICIRCNTCEATCPTGAVTHDSRNYVVDASRCNFCMACVPPCPTGSIDNWRTVPIAKAYGIDEQLRWDELPPELSVDELAAAGATAASIVAAEQMAPSPEPQPLPGDQAFRSGDRGASVKPWSAAHAYVNLYGPKGVEPFIVATVAGNVRVTEVGKDYDTHHVVLDFGTTPFPVLEGQSIGVLPPGTDELGRSHHARQYSIASARNGERPGYNNLSLTIKRVLEDHDGRPVRGVASNYMCDLKVGDTVKVIGPFGASFLMPNHPRSSIVMICTGTGSAPMRAMTEWRRRLRKSGRFEGGELMLFFGARSPGELPYFGPLQKLPREFIDNNLAFSRIPGEPKQYVQDLIRSRAADVARLLRSDHSHIYICGLKGMEAGVDAAFRDVCDRHALDWDELLPRLREAARYHVETY